jgi:hypothetical protein
VNAIQVGSALDCDRTDVVCVAQSTHALTVTNAVILFIETSVPLRAAGVEPLTALRQD